MNKEFVWTDELVHQYVSEVITGTIGFSNSPMDKFKASHTEVKGVDWEILEGGFTGHHHVWTEECNDVDCSIWAVRRISDNTIWTVGDDCFNGPIVRFNLRDNQITADFECGDVGCTKLLSELSKPIHRTKLFTTEDGVDVFHGDKVFMIVTANFHLQERIASYDRNWCALNDTCPLPNVPGLLYFNSKEKAEEYVILNKPCLSVNDVIGLWAKDGYFPMKAKELAKQRLDKQ